MPDEYEPRPFKCDRCGWILGESYREQNERVTRLRLYVVSRPPESGLLGSTEPIHYSVMGQNDASGIVCRNCFHLQSWYANQSAIKELLERRELRREKVSDG